MSRLPYPFIHFLLACLSGFFSSCWIEETEGFASVERISSFEKVSDIPVPYGYKRVEMTRDSFGHWLRNILLKIDNHVYLYDGRLKGNQSAQFAVMDIPVGKRDLQQCADAVMRLRAEYLFNEKKFNEIEFRDNLNRSYRWTGMNNRSGFDKYLEKVFGWCGTASLEKQLKPEKDIKEIRPGNVFIKGGFPGHAMIVMDVASDDKGNKIFMLAQSYMPAQDIHIVKNPANKKLSPWYEVKEATKIITPEWTFSDSDLKKW